MRRKLQGLDLGTSTGPTMDQAVAICKEILGAVEMDPDTQPELITGNEFSIILTGTEGKRPSMSLHEAGKMAQAQQAWRVYLAKMNKRAADQGQPRVVTMPKWHGVLVCPVCHELQVGSSRTTRASHECRICPARCFKDHKKGQINCPECKRDMQVIWTTDHDEIPKEWLL